MIRRRDFFPPLIFNYLFISDAFQLAVSFERPTTNKECKNSLKIERPYSFPFLPHLKSDRTQQKVFIFNNGKKQLGTFSNLPRDVNAYFSGAAKCR
jgi:hypothetical protein